MNGRQSLYLSPTAETPWFNGTSQVTVSKRLGPRLISSLRELGLNWTSTPISAATPSSIPTARIASWLASSGPGQVPLDAHGLVLRISAVKGLRRFLPHQGQAWLSVQLNGAHLLDAWLQTTRVQPIELPVQYQGLPGGEHQIELSLTTNSNTTARVRFVGLYWLLGSGLTETDRIDAQDCSP